MSDVLGKPAGTAQEWIPKKYWTCQATKRHNEGTGLLSAPGCHKAWPAAYRIFVRVLLNPYAGLAFPAVPLTGYGLSPFLSEL
jgi:hypothetical protein